MLRKNNVGNSKITYFSIKFLILFKIKFHKLIQNIVCH